MTEQETKDDAMNEQEIEVVNSAMEDSNHLQLNNEYNTDIVWLEIGLSKFEHVEDMEGATFTRYTFNLASGGLMVYATGELSIPRQFAELGLLCDVILRDDKGREIRNTVIVHNSLDIMNYYFAFPIHPTNGLTLEILAPGRHAENLLDSILLTGEHINAPICRSMQATSNMKTVLDTESSKLVFAQPQVDTNGIEEEFAQSQDKYVFTRVDQHGNGTRVCTFTAMCTICGKTPIKVLGIDIWPQNHGTASTNICFRCISMIENMAQVTRA